MPELVYRTTILKSGSNALFQALGAKKKIPVARFRVGDSYGFTPNSSGTNPTGNLVDTQYSDKIGISIINSEEIRVSLNFTEDQGNYQIGNIIIDLLVEDDNADSSTSYVPFIWWVSDIPIPKNKFDLDLGTVGNRYVFSFTEKFQNVDDAIAITVTPPVYGSLPQYSNQFTLPPANAALFQQGVLQNFNGLFRPVVFGRRAVDEKYFGFPLLDRLDSPFFGVLDGGLAGVVNAPYTGNWYWGGYLDTLEADFGDTVSGGDFTTDDSEYGDIIQGEPLDYGAL